MNLDALYDLEPREFVAARDALAKQLRKDGDKESAATVKKLPKPSVVAWAVNQVARSSAGDVGDLIAASEKVRDAQADAVRSNDASTLRTATADRRAIVQKLTAAAAKLAGDGHRDAVAATFDAASLDPAAVDLLRTGRLTRALEPAALFDLAGIPEPPERILRGSSAPGPQETSSERARNALARQRAEQELSAARDALARAEERMRRAHARLDELDA